MGDIEDNACGDGATAQTPLLLPSPTYHEGCPGCWLEQRKASSPDSLPYRDLTIIGVLCLCNSLPISSLFAYVYFMVQDLGIAKSATHIGTYAGLLGSSLLLGRFMSSTLWGFVADRYGHRLVIYSGTASTFIFVTLFGFSTNYWMALVSRLLTGIGNGMTATLRAYAIEVCHKKHQAFSLSVVGTMWGVGLIIGPAIGGYLAQPSQKLPSIFPSGSLFDRFPYALPNICISLIALTGFISCFWLPESLHTHKKSKRTMNGGVSVKDTDSGILTPGETELQASDTEVQVQDVERRLLKNRGFIASVSLNALWVVHAMAYAEVFPIWADSPKVLGGLAFTSTDVANVLALCGASLLLFQVLLFAPLVKRFGAIKCMRASALLTVPVTAIYPLIARLDGVRLWVVLILVSVTKNVLSSSTFTGTFILVNNSVVRGQRGIANGISTSVMSVFQALGPASAGALISWSEERMDAAFLPGMWMVFSILSVLSFIAFLSTFDFFLPSSLDNPLPEE